MIEIKHRYTNAVLRTIQADDLRGADLSNADLRNADLRGADLSNANLSNADLRGADLSNADLHNANLRGADLSNANLSNADLRNANLRNADLHNANLRGADLSNANLSNADLYGANLSNANLSAFALVPEDGAFVAWKALRNAIAKLEIPADAARTSTPAGRKCRASHVRVLAIYAGANDADPVLRADGLHDGTQYVVGEITTADSFDPDIRVECTHGIHFFVTRAEAAAYAR